MQRKRTPKRSSGAVWVPAEVRSAGPRRPTRKRVGAGNDPSEWLPEAAKRRAASANSRQTRAGKLDLNQATFEDLRALGLNVTQSSRLIAYRDTTGGLSSFAEIEELRGFGTATLDLLRSRARTNGS
jgi:DNA uptake protein ComE-like DNA-binding protein